MKKNEQQVPVTNEEPKNTPLEDVGSVRILFSFVKSRLLGIPDPVYEKVVLLKKVKKKLKKLGLKGINFSKNKMSAEFGKFLFQVYTYFYPLRKVIELEQPSAKKNFLQFLVLSVANDRQKEMLNQLLSEDFYLEILGREGNKKTSEKLKEMYKEITKSFSKEQIKKINRIYSLGDSLFNFLKYDLFVLLRKFSPEMKEDHIYNPPGFRELSITQVEGNLKEFTDHIYFLNPDANYFEFIENYGRFIGRDIIPQKDFQKFFNLIITLIRTNFVVLLVQYISKDVFFRPFHSYSEVNAYANFMKELVNSINTLQTKSNQKIKNETLDKIIKELFEGTEFMELTAYTPEQDQFLKRNNLDGFVYSQQLNVLKKFFLEKYNRYIRKNLHAVIVKGAFVSTEFREVMNSLYYASNNSLEAILELENKLKGKDGWDKLLNLIRGKTTDSSLSFLAKRNVEEINSDVLRVITDALSCFESLKDKLKIVVEDFNSGNKNNISNIKKMAGTTTVEIIKHLAKGFNDTSKLLYYYKMSMRNRE
ncbi:MAG: hypothetical protein CVV50_00195 [Spirochaetae bacterium HGW-Spirochaetae-6]|nr:MAG: hypothetical protein CVV50_00195 [Spirochaetae bacterium HGW-Spirochaetae-6]